LIRNSENPAKVAGKFRKYAESRQTEIVRKRISKSSDGKMKPMPGKAMMMDEK